MYFIGYDIGSSSVKATLLEGETNALVTSAQHPSEEMPMIAHHPGWAEQDPELWWECIIKVTRDILAKSNVNPEDVKSVGISYQMHGLVVVDRNSEILRPSIIWCDSRAVEIGDWAFEQLGEKYCLQNLLNSPGNFTASKLRWVKENEPHLFERIHKAMLPGDYIALKLTGQIQTTNSGLSEGIFYDFREERLSEELLKLYEIDPNLIPEIVPTFGLQAEVSIRASEETGLKKGTKVTYRAGDQPNNALSLNVLEPGELAATAGTSGVIYGVSDRSENDPLSRVNAFLHVNHQQEAQRIGILLCINGTGILNAWGRRNFTASSYIEMNELASKVAIGSDGLTILPFGNGSERILNNRNIGAHINGIELNLHSNAHLFRAIQEGIACSLRYGTDIMKELNLNPSVIRAGKSNMFLSEIFQSAVSNLNGSIIELYDTDGSQGAARGSGIGLGYYTQKTAFDGLIALKVIEPDNSKKDAYEDLYLRWNKELKKHIS